MNDSLTRKEVDELLKRLKDYQYAPLFIQPIEEVIASLPQYADIIKNPIDLTKIILKFNSNQYQSLEDLNSDIELMFTNCKTFNAYPKSWAHKAADAMQNFFNREFKKTLLRIEKQKTIIHSQLIKKKSESHISTQHNNYNPTENVTQNIQVISSTEDDRIAKRIKNIFQKLGTNLNVTDEQREEIINLIVKSIVKRSKSFEQIYEDTMKFLSKNLNNVNNIKSYFSRKFRKLLRSIKEEQNEPKNDKAFNIKINLNENEEKREENEKLEQVRKEVLNFINNQKVPEVFRNVSEYPIEPSLRKKINCYVNDIMNNFITKH